MLSSPVPAGAREVDTIEAAVVVLEELAAIPLRGIPPALLQDAQGVAIIPSVIKAGFVVGGRHGRGVVLARQADGSWGNPLFVTMSGGSIGWQVGVQSTDVVLIFKTRKSLTRLLEGKGKLTLGADAAVAAGPLGRQAEASTDGKLQAEIYSYSRSRGLFAGVSLEGAAILVDHRGNEQLYRVRTQRPEDLMNLQGVELPAAVMQLKAELSRQCAPLAPTVPFVPVPVPAPQPQGQEPPQLMPPVR